MNPVSRATVRCTRCRAAGILLRYGGVFASLCEGAGEYQRLIVPLRKIIAATVDLVPAPDMFLPAPDGDALRAHRGRPRGRSGCDRPGARTSSPRSPPRALPRSPIASSWSPGRGGRREGPTLETGPGGSGVVRATAALARSKLLRRARASVQGRSPGRRGHDSRSRPGQNPTAGAQEPQALPGAPSWELNALLDFEAERCHLDSARVETAYNIGFEGGLVAGRVEALRVVRGERRGGAEGALARQVRSVVASAGTSFNQSQAVLLEVAWALALESPRAATGARLAGDKRRRPATKAAAARRNGDGAVVVEAARPATKSDN